MLMLQKINPAKQIQAERIQNQKEKIAFLERIITEEIEPLEKEVKQK